VHSARSRSVGSTSELAGALLGKARATDVVDAAVVVIAEDGDQIVTSDPEDIAELARVADREIEIIEV
jgi:hypothetical protein